MVLPETLTVKCMIIIRQRGKKGVSSESGRGKVLPVQVNLQDPPFRHIVFGTVSKKVYGSTTKCMTFQLRLMLQVVQ